jgi:hypothetical protein
MPRKSFLIPARVGTALTAGAFVSNPSPEQHRTRIRAAMAAHSPLASALGAWVLTSFASSYHSLGVASYTTVRKRVVSVGALGMVFVPPPKGSTLR